MKKFYIPIFAILLLTSFMAQAQVYNSIFTNNVTHYTLDDPRFWGGTTLADVPPNNCTGCTIKINSDVTVVPFNGQLAANGGVGTTSQIPFANDPSLNHITLTNSTVNLYGNTTLTLNTYLTLTGTLPGSSITLGSNPTSVETIIVNDQIDFNDHSGIQLANNNTVINVNNLIGKTILGPYDELGNPGFKFAGLYSLFLVGGSYTQTLEANGIGSVVINGQYFAPSGDPFYNFNCKPAVPAAPHNCDFGLVYGPVTTQKVGTANPPDPNFGVIFFQSAVLPVDLVQFLALKNEDGSVNLKWATSQEINAGYYDIERSGDQSAWTKIGSVKAKGFSSTTTNYSFIDKLPIDGNGYYRLKMTDLDGKFKYSPTVSVTLKADARPLVVYNNPFSDMIRLKVNVSRAQNLTITVSDMLGKSYINQTYHAQSGDNLVNLPSSISSHGVYVLRIYGDSYDQTVKLQKQ